MCEVISNDFYQITCVFELQSLVNIVLISKNTAFYPYNNHYVDFKDPQASLSSPVVFDVHYRIL